MRKCDTYEDVAAYLLNRFASDLGLKRVEGKQPISGNQTGTTWTIDSKGVREADGATLIVECRRHTTSKAKQEELAALAYRIIDTGAGGGFYVSPLGLQEGAERVAVANDIVSVQLHEDSTPDEFVMRFLNLVFVGARETIVFREEARVEVIRGDDTNEDASPGG